MSLPLGAGDLVNFQSGLKASDLKNWRHVPASAVVQPTEAIKAELAAREGGVARAQAELNAQREAYPNLYTNNFENNTMNETNVAGLRDDEVQPRIEYIRNMIQSGEAAKYSFRAGNGDQTTDSVHQFLYWLQQRAQQMDNDGTYSPEMFK